MNVLIVVDMQNDFIDGSLGTNEAIGIVQKVKAKVDGFDGHIFFTRDTHKKDYLQTSEGRKLPVEHCIKDSHGWEISSKLNIPESAEIIDKPTFGSVLLGEKLKALDNRAHVDSVTLIGLCTDICVISNAMLVKAFLPEVRIIVDSACCAGVTPKSHQRALEAMSVCQVEVI